MKSRLRCFATNNEVNGVEVGLALASARDLDEAAGLQLLDEAVDAADAHADRLRERVLAGEAEVVVPGVAQEQSVGGLGLDRDVRVLEDEIRDLSEAVQGNGIRTVE